MLIRCVRSWLFEKESSKHFPAQRKRDTVLLVQKSGKNLLLPHSQVYSVFLKNNGHSYFGTSCEQQAWNRMNHRSAPFLEIEKAFNKERHEAYPPIMGLWIGSRRKRSKQQKVLCQGEDQQRIIEYIIPFTCVFPPVNFKLWNFWETIRYAFFSRRGNTCKEKCCFLFPDKKQENLEIIDWC